MILSTFVAAVEGVTFGLMIEAVASGAPPAAVIDEIVVIDEGIEDDGNFDMSCSSRSTLFV